MTKEKLRSPYPWFGAKSLVADEIWKRFGVVHNYIEPFFGSGAVLLSRPSIEGAEIVNDLNGWLCNFWRALQINPDGVAQYANWPISELDLHARGDWLFYRPEVADFIERLRSDPNYYDIKSAGWWVWGQSSWIGGEWGPNDNRKCVKRQVPSINRATGIHRKSLNESNDDHALRSYFRNLSERLRSVRIICGDWSRAFTPSLIFKDETTAIFLDPPYGVQNRDLCYGQDDDLNVSADVRSWCLQHAENKRLRIALCGYEGEHDMPHNWERFEWKAKGGYSNQKKKGEKNNNSKLERIWFSPSCQHQPDLFNPINK